MRIAAIAALAVLVFAGAADAQLVTGAPVRAYFTATSCPTGWTAGETRPAQPVRYLIVDVVASGRRVYVDQAGLDLAYTVAAVLDSAARDAAVTSGAIKLIPGQAAAVRCLWRPIGGTP